MAAKLDLVLYGEGANRDASRRPTNMIGSLKSLCSLWTNLAQNQRYGPYIDSRDITTFQERVAKEGLSFLTTTLPRLGKALDRYHATSAWEPPLGFRTETKYAARQLDMLSHGIIQYYGQREVPLFLGTAIYCALEGDSVAVDCVRQLSYLFYKLEVEYDQNTVTEFLASFRKVDAELFSVDDCLPGSNQQAIINSMRLLIGRVLCNADPTNIRPRHGGGSTACRTKNWDKYHRLRYFPKLDDIFPYSEHFFYSPSHLVDELENLENAPYSVPQARVCLVPKDSRGPRVISCEPAELMYIQQGIMSLLYEVLETNPITRGQVNFLDQGINKDLARLGSITGTLATIDLSEASDRVSLDLVRSVFPPRWVEALEACRSETTILPDGSIVKLNKFAPMGSSCCFPVEALVFWACAQATIRIQKPSLASKYATGTKVFVYGDDIVFNTEYFELITMGLESIGLVVNRDKSYFKGPFRESCGGDYHNGYDVTPVRLRKTFDPSATSLLTSADFCNNLIAKFGYDTVTSIVSFVETLSCYHFPRTELELPATIRVPWRACNDALFQRRYNKSLQRYEHRILSPSNRLRRRRPPNWGELLRKELTRKNKEKTADRYENRLSIADSCAEPGEYADPHSVHTKWVWAWLG